MEYIKKCNVCGQIWCYDDKDIKNNQSNAKLALISSIGTIAGAASGNRYSGYENNKIADRALNKVIDYNRCPNCNSKDVSAITKEELEKIHKFESKKNSGVFANLSGTSLIKKTKLLIDEEDWMTAQMYLEQLLDMEPDNHNVYLLCMLVENKVKDLDGLIDSYIYKGQQISDDTNFKYAFKFGSEKTKLKLLEIDELVNEGVKEKLKIDCENLYQTNIEKIDTANNLSELKELKEYFAKNKNNQSIKYYDKVNNKIAKIEKKNKFKNRLKILSIFIIIFILVISISIYNYINMNNKYKLANKYLIDGKYDKASDLFLSLDNFKDSEKKMKEADSLKLKKEYDHGYKLYKQKKFEEAFEVFNQCQYKDCKNMAWKSVIAYTVLTLDNNFYFGVDEKYADYYKNNLKKITSSEEISKLILNQTYKVRTHTNDQYYKATFNSDYTVSNDINKTIYWQQKDNFIYYEQVWGKPIDLSDETDKFGLYKATDEVYVLGKAGGSIEFALVKPDSELDKILSKK